jgi:hypothetical protein
MRNSTEVTMNRMRMTTRRRSCTESLDAAGILTKTVADYLLISITSSSVWRHSGKSAGSQAAKPGSAKRRASPG